MNGLLAVLVADVTYADMLRYFQNCGERQIGHETVAKEPWGEADSAHLSDL